MKKIENRIRSHPHQPKVRTHKEVAVTPNTENAVNPPRLSMTATLPDHSHLEFDVPPPERQPLERNIRFNRD